MAASDDQVRAAYRVLARRLHPDLADAPADRRQAEAAMASLNEAWRVLGDSHRRAAYDLARRQPDPVARPSPAGEEFHGRSGDSFQAIRVPRPVGCLLQFGPVALIVGNEAHGLPFDIDRLIDDRIHIPTAGRAESLNVAMAASILVFETARQRRQMSRQGSANPEHLDATL